MSNRLLTYKYHFLFEKISLTHNLCVFDVRSNHELTNVFTECQRRELPTVETRRVEVTSSLSDVSTVPDLSLRTRPSREWPSETSLKLLLSEICLKPLSTLNMLFQRLTTSCTTVFLALSTLELSELDLELTEESELLHKDQDSTETTRFLQLTLLRKLCKSDLKQFQVII